MADETRKGMEAVAAGKDREGLPPDAAESGNTVGDLEKLLFGLFPEQYCEPWDKCGLLVGGSRAVVEGVAIALDPQVATIEKAAAAGCNVLLTHHPAYLSAPERFVDPDHGGTDPAMRVVTAIREGVSLIAMHTNLDRSPLAMEVLMDKLGLIYMGGLVEETEGLPPFGGIGVPGAAGSSPVVTLRDLAERCARAYGVDPRVWGDPDKVLRRVGIANGSSSSFARAIVESTIDCVVTGEMSYHNASEVAASGTALIELGHDVSEFPLLDVLQKAVVGSTVFGGNVHMMGPDVGWWQPGSAE